jgi:hypothetical protein
LSPGGVTAAEAGRDGLMGWEEILAGSARWLAGSALSKGRRGSRVNTVHGSESIPAIRIIIWLREWEVNGMGHHSGSEGGVGWVESRIGLAME